MTFTRAEFKLMYAQDALRSGHIEILYDDIDELINQKGSCGECSRWNKDTGECYGCIGYDCVCEADFYCANFERKT